MAMLNKQSPLPLYHQLAEILKERIRSGEYPTGSRIPPETALAESYRIGRPTVRQAIDILIRKGMLESKRGSGTFVKAKEKEVDLFSFAGTTSAFHKQGISVKTRILERIALREIGQDPENPFAGQRAYFVSRLTLARKEPVLIEDLYLHPELFAGIHKIDLKGKSLAQVVSDTYYMKPLSGRQNFRVTRLPLKRAAFLNLTDTDPVLAVKRFLNFPQAQNAVYAELYCRTDSFVFSQTIGGVPND